MSLSVVLFCVSVVIGQEYYFDKIQDTSNVFGQVPDPDQSTPYITFMGTYENVDDCVDALATKSNDNNRVYSYTYMTSKYYVNTYRRHCYGLFGRQYGSVYTNVPDNGAISGQIVFPCQSDLDCSLNGVCNSNTGNCTCSPAWKGYRCGELNLLPASKDSGYVYRNNISSWGGAVLVDKNNSNSKTKYHMYVAKMDKHCGLNSWSCNSMVIHAQSTNGYNSLYTEMDTIHKPFAHEPDAIFGPNGEYVLYYIAYNISGGYECTCSDGVTPDEGCDPPGMVCNTFMQYSTSGPDGPFTEPMKIITGEDDPNLAGVILQNGTFIGLSRNWINGYSTSYLVTNHDWKNPDTYKIGKDSLFPQLTSGGGTEDPFVYRDCNGNFHGIFNNQSPDYQINNCGGHAYSADGINWVYTGRAFGNNITWTDGSTFIANRRERPHFIFDDDGCTPIALTNGVGYGNKDGTITLIQPLNTI